MLSAYIQWGTNGIGEKYVDLLYGLSLTSVLLIGETGVRSDWVSNQNKAYALVKMMSERWLRCAFEIS